MDTLLVAPPYSPFTPRESAVPPLGLARLAAIAAEYGSVTVCDMGVHEAAGLDGWKVLISETALSAPQIVGIGPVVTSNRVKSLRIARLLKAKFPNAQIVVGGPDVTFTYKTILESETSVDAVFIGESEVSWRSFLEADGHAEGITGIAYRDSGRIAFSSPRFLTKDELDSLATPGWEFFPMSVYRRIAEEANREPYLPIETSRGCALACAFCACSALFERRFRNRSPESVIREIHDVYERFDVRRFSLNDDNPSINVSHLLHTAESLVRQSSAQDEFELTFSATVDSSVFRNPTQMALLRRAGFREVFMGCETATPSVIGATRKTKRPNQWPEYISLAVTSSRTAGIASRTSWILGLPLETRATFMSTIDFIKKCAPDTALLSLLQPYPGTEMESIVNDPENPYGLRWISDSPTAMIASKFDPVVESEFLSRDEIVDLAYSFITELSPLLQANVSGSPYYLFELWSEHRASEKSVDV